MCLFDKSHKSLPLLWQGCCLFLIYQIAGGCLQSNEKSEFETDLISIGYILDSCFSHDFDSIRTVTKTIEFTNEPPETRKLEAYNIHKDLELIRKYDIATPRWAEFVTTTRKDSAGLTLIDYHISNNRAPVRSISIVKMGDLIQSLDIFNEKNSVVSQQNLRINWVLKSGYSIANESKLFFRKPSKFKMKVEY